MDEIEIEAFRADTKASKGLTADHIADAAKLYDADKNPAPLVFGHPTNDSPALGEIAGARTDGNRLFVRLKNIAADVVTAVREGRILNRSIAFWSPDHPSNPHPGKYTIRHLGLLGGQAPAIPGMGRLRFSADESMIEGDGDPDAAVVFRSSDSGGNGTPVAEITEPPAKPATPANKEPNMPTAEELKAAQDRADAAERRIAELEKAESDRAAAFAATEAQRRVSENKAAIDKAVADGKVLPAEVDDLAKLFEALPTTALAFSVGEKEPREALAAFLNGLPKRAPGSAGSEQHSPQFGAPPPSSEGKEKADRALAAANAGLGAAWKAAASATANA